MPSTMPKILIVDDDPDMLNLHKLRLGNSYDAVTSSLPEEALGLALEHKPAAILLDLLMPELSGFELCHTLHTLSYTARTPIFVITGESEEKYRTHCEALGASAYFQKPVDYQVLRHVLAEKIEHRPVERRAHVRVAMQIALKLRVVDSGGNSKVVSTFTENVSTAGFLAPCPVAIAVGAIVEVFLGGSQEHFAGQARAARVEAKGTPWQKYGFQFTQTTSDWILHS